MVGSIVAHATQRLYIIFRAINYTAQVNKSPRDIKWKKFLYENPDSYD
jgi:hypothetical protein